VSRFSLIVIDDELRGVLSSSRCGYSSSLSCSICYRICQVCLYACQGSKSPDVVRLYALVVFRPSLPVMSFCVVHDVYRSVIILCNFCQVTEWTGQYAVADYPGRLITLKF